MGADHSLVLYTCVLCVERFYSCVSVNTCRRVSRLIVYYCFHQETIVDNEAGTNEQPRKYPDVTVTGSVRHLELLTVARCESVPAR